MCGAGAAFSAHCRVPLATAMADAMGYLDQCAGTRQLGLRRMRTLPLATRPDRGRDGLCPVRCAVTRLVGMSRACRGVRGVSA